MKKHILAAAALSAFSAAASAQTSVTTYGIVDAGLVSERGGPNGSATKLESGVSTSSRLGFRGSEDIGNGLSAMFTVEMGLLADTGALDNTSNVLFNRQAFVGLKGPMGAITMGRQYTPIYSTLLIADPFGNNYGGASGQLMSGEKAGTRMNNTVMYASPDLDGFSTQAAYGFGEVAGDSAKSRQIGFAAGYAKGPATIRLAHNQTNNATATDRARNTLLVGKYDFGMLAVSLGYGINKGLGKIDSRDLLLGVSVPFGAHTVMATYIRKDDKSAANTLDAHQVAAAYNYALSKRTSLYAAYAKLSNTNFTTTKFGTGDKELDIGIRHTF
jgi:predicted porin